MIALIRSLLALLLAPFRAKLALEAEIVTLQQQIIVSRCKLRGRVRLSNGGRIFFVWLYRLFPSSTGAMPIIRPDTLIRWYCVGFHHHHCLKSRGRVGLCVPIYSSAH